MSGYVMHKSKYAFPRFNEDTGMELCDYFAAKALAELIATVPFTLPGGISFAAKGSPEYVQHRAAWQIKVATEAYQFADAMMEARGK